MLGVSWLDPNYLLDHFGGSLIWISLAIVFVECGLFFPFLPGDTLLFSLGLFISIHRISVLGVSNRLVEVIAACLLLSVAAFLGNVVGYEIGRRIGPRLYERDGRIIKRKYLDSTSTFFETHGNQALVIGRFVPFVRTYITVVAGVTQMERRRFFTWSAVGAVAWVISITLLGYFLGGIPGLGDNIDYVILLITAFTIIPIVLEGIRQRAKDRKKDDQATS
ncbi:VTT domain-containing protein [Nocardioides sp. TRM66260-LWL]|uniref:DedA family protein n=1 Tax=Nocardioides sp. TRM66260-LWL TaxID=2874478 RepID=UPI001CC77A25|nr:VTT domain-containing protein [Nocardioides sp. TRM66260-LWL]MBZ5735689.1 VTT domain-containing protein [Nocardioides sp. TRM66260-LWL]